MCNLYVEHTCNADAFELPKTSERTVCSSREARTLKVSQAVNEIVCFCGPADLRRVSSGFDSNRDAGKPMEMLCERRCRRRCRSATSHQDGARWEKARSLESLGLQAE